jgi:diaminopropionate ammonia-lyase
VVIDPARAASLFETARDIPFWSPLAGPTVTAMLECYEPLLVAWRIIIAPCKCISS